MYKNVSDISPYCLSTSLDLIKKNYKRLCLQHNLNIIHTFKTAGDWAFSFAGPRVWNCHSIQIRNSESADLFKKKTLKIYLYPL